MYTIKKILLITIILFGTTVNALAQKGRGHGNGNHNGNHRGTKVVVKQRNPHHNHVRVRSPYRPAKVIVYHPHWRPNYGYNRRWVYFPRYNFYWDNWRQGYYFMSGPTWVFNATPPPVVVNVNLDKETNYELKETEDDMDDVYRTNSEHQKEFKADNDK
ncbi:MAG: hypothetical protein V4565_15530 [Bacteroidota bacterium]